MIDLHIDHEKMELEMRGSDLVILDELSLAVTRILYALEHSQGNPKEENLTYLVLSLIEQNQSG
ncbi:MAG: hypothetical protein IJ642_02435 [Oscillospiraceae bacterium]|nr:hypothetical protein [Oscillospiraceae bacterium]